jgi:sucrose-phosphate synthase
MHILFFNPQGNFNQGDSHLTEHPDFGGQLVYVKETAMAMVAAGHEVDIVTRRIIDPEWPEFSADTDYYEGFEDGLRIVRIPCGGDPFLAKEQLWPHLPEFVRGTVDFYGDSLPDFVTAHYADGGYCAALMQEATGLQFTFTGHSLGAQKLDKLGMNLSNARTPDDEAGVPDHNLHPPGTHGTIRAPSVPGRCGRRRRPQIFRHSTRRQHTGIQCGQR